MLVLTLGEGELSLPLQILDRALLILLAALLKHDSSLSLLSCFTADAILLRSRRSRSESVELNEQQKSGDLRALSLPCSLSRFDSLLQPGSSTSLPFFDVFREFLFFKPPLSGSFLLLDGFS